MQNLRNPRWLFLTQTLCAFVLFWLFYDAYDTIHTQLSPQSKTDWKNFALVWISFSLFSIGYALFRLVRKEKISFWYNVVLVITQVLLLVLFFVRSDSLFPFSIPQWMLPGNMGLYATTFLMPGIVHGMLNLAAQPLKVVQRETPLPYLAAALVLPSLFYLSVIFLMSMDGEFRFFSMAVPVTFAVVLTLLFSYALTRGLYLFAVRNSASLSEEEVSINIVVTLVLPFAGLLFNQFLFRDVATNSGGIFGNFSHPVTYLLALLNGLFLTVSYLRRTTLTFFLFRAGMFSFSLYFFLVFLPFLPLSLFAIIAIGIGFLMLAPLAVFVLHAVRLSQDFTALRSRYPAAILWLGGFASFALIPAVITGLFLAEKNRFHEALDYVYSPDYNREYKLDSRSVRNTLTYLRRQKEDVGFSQSTPYISTWYTRLVLGHQTLTESRISEMEKVFGGRPEAENNGRGMLRPMAAATLQDIQSQSRYDEARKLWVSDLTLRLRNDYSGGAGMEYTTDITLPVGCAVSDYFLEIEGRRERGMLAEKKSALWVFNNIVNTRRDPGIVYYVSPNRLRLRVFPVMPNEVRTTGLQLLHPEPVSLVVDKKPLQLGDPGKAVSSTLETGHFIRLSSADVARLPRQARKPYFHFLVDAHEGNKSRFANDATAIRGLSARYPALFSGAQISAVSSVVETESYTPSWAESATKKDFSDGFFLERSLRQSLVKSYEAGTDRYPVFVVFTDSLSHAVLPFDFADLQFCFPETPFFYHLTPNGNLRPHSLLQNSRAEVSSAVFAPGETPVRRWQNGSQTVFLPDTSAPAFILKKPLFQFPDSALTPRSEMAALTLRAMEQSALLYPDQTNAVWKSAVRASMKTHVLSSVTAFMVVENEAQRQVLRKKQEAMLSGKAALSAGEAEEDAERMSEPDAWMIVILLGLAFVAVRWRKKRLLAAH